MRRSASFAALAAAPGSRPGAVSAKALRIIVPLGATARLAALDYEPAGSTPAQLAALIESDTAKWRRIVKETNHKPEE